MQLQCYVADIYNTVFTPHFLNKNKLYISSESGSLPLPQWKILYMYAPVLMCIKLLMLGLTLQTPN